MRSEPGNTATQPADETLRRLHGLTTALVCDVMDKLGVRETSFAGHSVRALYGLETLTGRAFTLAAQETQEQPVSPYEQLLDAYGFMAPGDVVVIGTAGEMRSGIWGGLLSVAALARGVVGAVTDGLVRDIEEMERLGFPVYAAGASPLDSAGRLEVVGHSMPIACGEAKVVPGDLVLADRMGVAFVPQSIAEDVLRLAEEKRSSEDVVRDVLTRGDSPSEVFARYRVL